MPQTEHASFAKLAPVNSPCQSGPFALCLKSPVSPGHHSMQISSVRMISFKEENCKSARGTRETSQENLGGRQHTGTFPMRQQAEKRPGSCRAGPNCYALRRKLAASQNPYNCFSVWKSFSFEAPCTKHQVKAALGLLGLCSTNRKVVTKKKKVLAKYPYGSRRRRPKSPYQTEPFSSQLHLVQPHLKTQSKSDINAVTSPVCQASGPRDGNC